MFLLSYWIFLFQTVSQNARCKLLFLLHFNTIFRFSLFHSFSSTYSSPFLLSSRESHSFSLFSTFLLPFFFFLFSFFLSHPVCTYSPCHLVNPLSRIKVLNLRKANLIILILQTETLE